MQRLWCETWRKISWRCWCTNIRTSCWTTKASCLLLCWRKRARTYRCVHARLWHITYQNINCIVHTNQLEDFENKNIYHTQQQAVHSTTSNSLIEHLQQDRYNCTSYHCLNADITSIPALPLHAILTPRTGHMICQYNFLNKWTLQCCEFGKFKTCQQVRWVVITGSSAELRDLISMVSWL